MTLLANLVILFWQIIYVPLIFLLRWSNPIPSFVLVPGNSSNSLAEMKKKPKVSTVKFLSNFIKLKHRHFFNPYAALTAWAYRQVYPDAQRSKELLNSMVPSEQEKTLEAVKQNEVLVFDQSNPEGTSIHIEVTLLQRHVCSKIFLHYNGISYHSEDLWSPLEENEDTIVCGPLRIEVRSAFRKWRLIFRGYLLTSDESVREFVTFSGWWRATSEARFLFENAGLKTFQTIVDAAPYEFIDNLTLIQKIRNRSPLLQFGEYYVKIDIGESSEELRLRGSRSRTRTGAFCSEQTFNVYLDNGNRVYFSDLGCARHERVVRHGVLNWGDHSVSPVQIADVSNFDLNSNALIKFDVTGKLPFSLRKHEIISKNEYERADGFSVEIITFKVSNGTSSAVAVLRKTTSISGKDLTPPTFHHFIDYKASIDECHAVVPFRSRSCADKELTGGKGSRLGMLSTIASNFSVPPGVVVTTKAYERHLDENPRLAKLIRSLETQGMPLEECITIGKEIEKGFVSSTANSDILQAIEAQGLSFNAKFAVRSSAVGEDGSDLSSAGQLDSYLNLSCDQIASNLVKCWASNFRTEVISYRKTYGQALTPPMAVVVQEMVSDGIAGVMFTNDPTRFDNGKIIINALKGCGEQIVSGVETPDEIVVDRFEKGKVNRPDPCCLSLSSIFELADIGIQLEKSFGKPQDVELVITDKIYIVQSRDITGLDRETQFELETEFDTETLTDKEITTTANVGEVFSTAMTPLECSILLDIYDKVMTDMSNKERTGQIYPHFHVHTAMKNQRIFLNCGEMFLHTPELIRENRITEIVIAGEKLFNEEMFKQAEERFPPIPKWFRMKNLYVMIKTMLVTSYQKEKLVLELTKQTEELRPEGNFPFETLIKVSKQQKALLTEVVAAHTHQSMFSSFTYIVAGMLIRGSEKGDVDSDTLTDIATVFSSNQAAHVISADVPTALKRLACDITSDGLAEKFKLLEGEDAIQLMKTGNRTGNALRMFMKSHGHRGQRELYLKATTWSENPDLLIHSIKAILGSSELQSKSVNLSVEEVVDSLICKPTGMRRKLLTYMVNETHRGVSMREQAKDCLVRATHEYRTTLKKAAKNLYDRGYLPNIELFYYMTLDEAIELHHTRSAKIVSRAHQRKKTTASLGSLLYNHVYHGPIKPIEQGGLSNCSMGVALHGTPVYQGKVTGIARVAKTLDEAKHTKPGEILITSHTDICWSPFFPILKGIVTEIGGLLSHGAVVAREYGLPSLIAVHNATNSFQTGDTVLLDSFKGTITKLEKETDD